MSEENKTLIDIVTDAIAPKMTDAYYQGIIVGAHTGALMAWGKIRKCTSAKEIKRILKAEADKAQNALNNLGVKEGGDANESK